MFSRLYVDPAMVLYFHSSSIDKLMQLCFDFICGIVASKRDLAHIYIYAFSSTNNRNVMLVWLIKNSVPYNSMTLSALESLGREYHKN